MNTEDTPDTAVEHVRNLPAAPADNHPVVGFPDMAEMRRIEFAAQALARTDMVPKALRGKPDAVFGVVLAARELRIPPMQGLRDINMVDGTPSPSAKLMRELIRRNGHTLELVSAQNDETEARYRFRRREWEPGRWEEWTYTLDDAVRAGLVAIREGKPHARSQQGKPLPWELHTAAMLRARATSSLAREWFPECLGALMYLPEELGATWVDPEGNVTEGPQDARTDDHIRWDDLLAELDDDSAAKAAQAFQERVGRPFGFLSADAQKQWADWLERHVEAWRARRDEAEGITDAEDADDDRPEDTTAPPDDDPTGGHDTTSTNGDGPGGDVVDVDAVEEVNLDDGEDVFRAVTQRLGDLPTPIRVQVVNDLRDRFALPGSNWADLTPDQAGQALTMIEDARQVAAAADKAGA